MGFSIVRTQIARETPFDNSTNGFTATEVQSAIEEANNVAAKPVYPIQASYNGSANVGRYLEIFPGEGSDTAPLLVPYQSYITAVTIQASANTNGSIEIFNFNTNTVLYSASFNGGREAAYLNLYVDGINPHDDLAFRVAGASVNKPKLRMWLKTV